MAKIARLPGGKILEFADHISDKEMQRAVRKELGVTQELVLEAFEELVKQVTSLLDDSKAAQSRHKEAMEEAADAMSANSSRLAAELGDAMRAMVKANEKMTADLVKSMSSHVTMATKLHLSMDHLQRTLDAAIGQSLEVLEQATIQGRKAAEVIEHGGKEFAAAGRQLAIAAEMQLKASAMTRRAKRNHDGSWTLEPGKNAL